MDITGKIAKLEIPAVRTTLFTVVSSLVFVASASAQSPTPINLYVADISYDG